MFFSLKKLLPPDEEKKARSNKDIEKKILEGHRKLNGVPEIEAKLRYVKLARSLPAFGVSFFLVRVGSMRLEFI